MSRTQKKCFMASAGLHLLLLLVLLIGPALSFSSKAPPVTPIDFIPSKIIEGAMAGGGNPNANPPPPAPPQPPTPEQPPRIEQPKEVPQPTQVTKNDLNPEPTSKPKHERKISTKLVTRPSTDKPANARPSSDSRDAQAKRDADAVGKAVAGLRNNLAPTTTIDLQHGPGGGGETYAGVEQAILSVYDHAWVSPEGMDTSEAVVEVSVTIESDGTVSSAHITHASGDARVDQSVQRALDRVSSIPGWDGKRRTVEFSFKSRAKELT